MDSSAIKLIQETAIGAYNGKQERMPTGTIALPDNYCVVDLEQFQQGRRRFRGKLATASLADFVAYVKANGNGEPPDCHVEGFIDAESLAATVIFNLYDADLNPGHADWRATLKLRPTAARNALYGVLDRPMTQAQIIDWLEDWSRNVASLTNEDGNSVSLGAAITAIRKIQISSKRDSTHVEEGRKVARSAMEEVEAKATASQPHRIDFLCEPYLGLRGRVFPLRVSVLTNHDDPRLVLRLVGKEDIEEEIAQEFKSVLIEEVGDAAKLTIGTFTP